MVQARAGVLQTQTQGAVKTEAGEVGDLGCILKVEPVELSD